MKTLTAVLVVTVFIIHISGYLIQVPIEPIILPEDRAPVQWLRVQKLIMPLFENVCEDSNDPIIRRLSQEFIPNSEDYLNPDVIPNLKTLMTSGLLPKKEIFSEFNPNHMKELKTIYEVLYYAKDFDAFYKAAAWARQHLNCGLYVSAIYMTMQNRKDMERLAMPAPYELLPNYFIDKDVIVQASSILAGQKITPTDSIRDEGNSYILDANYTAQFYENNDDSKLAYFREDIGLNSYYFLRKLRMAPWLNNDINDGYGENMYQMMKQFMARYNLERYANGLPELDGLNLTEVSDICYDPKLIYSDGYEFGQRTMQLQLPVNEEVTLLQTMENNIVSVVSHMRQGSYNKTQILNHLMEILVTGDRSYETRARQLLGKDLTSNGHASVLDHYMTSLRDPMFWKINKKIVDLVDSALKVLPTYSKNELYFPGVEVVNIDVKKMMTAYDYFVFDVTEALKIDNSNSTFNVKIGQPRLNHKPFTIKINISSLVSNKGLVKIYLGPKLMPGELVSKKNLFTLLDLFEVNLKIGTNIISRTSDDMKHFSTDFMSLKTIRKKIEDAEFGLDSVPLKMVESQFGYPSRLILPKGSPLGLPIQIFVFVAPFTKASFDDSSIKTSMEFNSAILSPGYPLDLMIEDRQLFALPNAMVKYVTVMQKGDKKIENYGGPGVTKQWYATNSYDPSSRPSYGGNYKKSYDYSSKRELNENIEFSTEINVDNFDDAIEPSLNNAAIEKSVLKENSGQDDIIINEPHLLQSTKSDITPKVKINKSYDYKMKKEQYPQSETTNYETFNYKIKKGQFEKKDYSSKTKDTNESSIAMEKGVNINKESFPVPTSNQDLISDEPTQNNIIVDRPVLKSSKFDYSSKKKDSFDYKAKKAQFNKKDYSAKRGNYTKYHTKTPEQETVATSTVTVTIPADDLAREIIYKDANDVNSVNELIEDVENYIQSEENKENVDDDIERKTYVDEEPLIHSPENIRKRIPTVYDFLFHTFDYEDNPELKVYE